MFSSIKLIMRKPHHKLLFLQKITYACALKSHEIGSSNNFSEEALVSRRIFNTTVKTFVYETNG
jgi:hypothetical protein